MKKLVFLKVFFISTMLICSVLALFACKPSNLPDVKFYVSASGADTNEGSEVSPFLTIEKAIDAVNSYESANADDCNYFIKIIDKLFINDSIALNESTLLNNGKSLTIEGVNGGTVSGGLDIPIEAFSSLDEQPQHLKTDILRNIVRINLNDYGVTNYPSIDYVGFQEEFTIPSIELFYNEYSLPLARYPDSGYLKSTDAAEGYAAGIKTSLPSSLLESWALQSGGYMSGFFYHDWADDTVSIDYIDTLSYSLFSDNETSYGERENARFYVFNYLSELDNPGEWYLDRESGELYIYLPEGAAGNITLTLTDSPLFEISGVSSIELKNLSLEAGRGDLVTISNSSEISFFNLTLRYAGRRAIYADNVTNVNIDGCVMYETGINAVELKGGNRATLESAENSINNCKITRSSRNVKTMPSIEIGGVGTTISRCHIFDVPHSAILFSGNDHTISYNEINNVCYLSADSGAVYSGRNYTYGGNVIEYNYFHDIVGNNDGTLGASDPWLGTCAVYLDDLVSGITVRNNLFVSVYRGILLGGGKNNILTGNVYADTTILISADSRGETWESYHVKNNSLENRLFDEKLNIRNSELWLTRFPYLEELISQYDNADTEGIYAPSGNIIKNNFTSGTKLEMIESSVKLNGEYFSPVYYSSDYLFIDAEAGDYSIRSEAIQAGIPNISLDSIGYIG